MELFFCLWPLLGSVLYHSQLEVGLVGVGRQAICLPRSLRDASIPTGSFCSTDLLLRSTTVLRVFVFGDTGSLSNKCHHLQLREPTTIILSGAEYGAEYDADLKRYRYIFVLAMSPSRPSV